MSWSVEWAANARHDLKRLDRKTLERIVRAVMRYATTEQGDVKPLRGVNPAEWRLRVGKWRVRFMFIHPTNTIAIVRVLPRGGAYKR